MGCGERPNAGGWTSCLSFRAPGMLLELRKLETTQIHALCCIERPSSWSRLRDAPRRRCCSSALLVQRRVASNPCACCLEGRELVSRNQMSPSGSPGPIDTAAWIRERSDLSWRRRFALVRAQARPGVGLLARIFFEMISLEATQAVALKPSHENGTESLSGLTIVRWSS